MFKSVSSKVDFPKLEQKILSSWYRSGIVEKYLTKNKNSSKKFKFIDGPITANNPMGVHHAWGRTYKDLWQRFFNMKGYKQRFQNGFDEQGLWIEVEVEKELGLKTKKDIENLVPGDVSKSIAKFVGLCKERVKKFSRVQTEQSRRLGYFMDWENSYHTSSDENNYAIWHYLKTINEKGWLYKGRDSVPWCPRCGTAISQHEILTEEYKEITHKAVFFRLPLVGSPGQSLLIWTTTPWTIPGNVAVAVNKDEVYETVPINSKESVWIMKKTKDRLIAKGILQTSNSLNESASGASFVGREYIAPFDDFPRVKTALGVQKHRIVIGDDKVLPVTSEEGTGVVHVATGAGTEDFQIGKKEKLPVVELIDEEAVYIKGLDEFSGKNAKKHPEIILDYLRNHESGKYFFKEENYKHRYPTCWRCKTELVWRVVDEWYIAMDSPSRKAPGSKYSKKTYRQLMREVIKEIKWIPKWGYDRELDWLNNMHDWLISKKRYWGLALPIWECSKCGNFDVVGSKDELKKRAISGWEKFEGNSPHRPWIDQVKIKCSKCAGSVSRVEDVGNVWLDAGIVPFSTTHYFSDKDFWKEWFPADFITESFAGQFKNWFYSLIAMATALENTTSFKTLLGHGQVRDEKGEEMHKSKGNAIWFDEAAERMGVDVMRWVYLRSNPEHNVNFGYHVADVIRRRFFLILWNVYVFFVTYANLDKWQPSETEKGELSDPLDRWIISELNKLIKEVGQDLEKFEASSASRKIEDYVLDLSTWYIRRIRNRVGPTADNFEVKDSTYQVLYTCLTILSKIMAPFTPYVTEEIYTNLTEEPSVHLTEYPKADNRVLDKELSANMIRLRELAESGHSLRKKEKIKVRQPLKSFTYGENYKKLPKELEDVLAEELNVKDIKYDTKKQPSLDLNISQGLMEEGYARDVVRKIQEQRKEAGCRLDELVIAEIPGWPKKFEDYIKAETLVKKLQKGKDFKVIKM